VNLAEKVREVPDWPQPGVGFKDVTPLLADPKALAYSIEQLAKWGAEKKPDLIVGAEARGFILGAAIAKEIGCGFVPARRPGKLPPETISAEEGADGIGQEIAQGGEDQAGEQDLAAETALAGALSIADHVADGGDADAHRGNDVVLAVQHHRQHRDRKAREDKGPALQGILDG
jgi:hypothetical protein